jgi:catalase (peroxidase I)
MCGAISTFDLTKLITSQQDCGAWNTSLGETGGCDGSLILAPEFPRTSNRGLESIAGFLLQRARAFNVSAADMIVFAANHATRSCARGPLVPTWVGRNDSSIPSPDNLLPSGRESADEILAMFEAKGFNASELAALVGAHSTAKQEFFDPARAGASQDSTPEIWDTNFYTEAAGNDTANVLIFDTDRNLAADSRTSGKFIEFRNQR